MSSSETRRTMELYTVGLDLTLVELPLSVLKGLVGGFQGTIVFGKLPKVKENPVTSRNFYGMLNSPKMRVFKNFFCGSDNS